jgi:CRISPR-associated protein Cas2
MLLIEALTEVINHREDQVMLIDLGPSEGRGRESIETIGRGLDLEKTERIAVIV